MKQVIKDILEDVAKGQPNLESEAAREMISNLIMAGIKSNDIDDICEHNNDINSTCSECDEQQARDTWVCSICNKSTYDVEYDYVGSGTNHLGCELEIEMKNPDD